MSKYTKGQDGNEYQTVVVRLRLSREDVKELRKLARRMDIGNSYIDVVNAWHGGFELWLQDQYESFGSDD